MGTSTFGGTAEKKHRRSQRVMLALPVTVSGEITGRQFSEDTRTVVLNAHGALIALAAKVSRQQILQLKSPSHPEKRACRVTYVGPTTEGKTQLGIEFTEPAPHFWQIAFPPEDWTPVADVPVVVKSKP